jgi:hypothetical protein
MHAAASRHAMDAKDAHACGKTGGMQRMQRGMQERCAAAQGISVERVEALLLWQDPYASAKVFGAGLYILICLRHLVCGAHPAYRQPSSSGPGLVSCFWLQAPFCI